MKSPGPTGWRGVMNQGPRPSDFGLSPLADNVDSITQRQRVRVSRISHGIGGGMRVSEEDTLVVMPRRFSSEWMGRRLSLTGSRAVFGIYAALLVCTLLVVHVHLRFKIHDMNMQQHALQNIQRSLQRESSMLEAHMASLRDLGRLHDYAVANLNMTRIERSAEVTVAPQLSEKYSEQAIAKARNEKQAELAALEKGPKRGFSQLADMAWAFANPKD